MPQLYMTKNMSEKRSSIGQHNIRQFQKEKNTLMKMNRFRYFTRTSPWKQDLWNLRKTRLLALKLQVLFVQVGLCARKKVKKNTKATDEMYEGIQRTLGTQRTFSCVSTPPPPQPNPNTRTHTSVHSPPHPRFGCWDQIGLVCGGK